MSGAFAFGVFWRDFGAFVGASGGLLSVVIFRFPPRSDEPSGFCVRLFIGCICLRTATGRPFVLGLILYQGRLPLEV